MKETDNVYASEAWDATVNGREHSHIGNAGIPWISILNKVNAKIWKTLFTSGDELVCNDKIYKYVVEADVEVIRPRYKVTIDYAIKRDTIYIRNSNNTKPLGLINIVNIPDYWDGFNNTVPNVHVSEGTTASGPKSISKYLLIACSQ